MLGFARLGPLYDGDVMCKWILKLWCHIVNIMRCINLGWTKYDVTDDVKCRVEQYQHCWGGGGNFCLLL